LNTKVFEDQLIHGAGYVILKDLDVDLQSFCMNFGTLEPQNEQMDIITEIKDAEGNRGYQNNKRLPFHTDCGSDLLAIKRKKSAGFLKVSDSRIIIKNVPKSYLSVFLSPLPYFWGDFPILTSRKGTSYYRYLRGYMKKDQLSMTQNIALDTFDITAEECSTHIFLEPGDICILNNTRILHSRDEFNDPNRRSLRVWINSPLIDSPFENRFKLDQAL